MNNLESPLKKYVKEYCVVSSIQGLRKIVQSTCMVERLWWIGVLLLCIVGCTVMIYQVFEKWITTPVLVSLATKETHIYNVPFPAVTICPETKVASRCLNYTKVLSQMKQNKPISLTESQTFDYMMPLCQLSNHESKLREQEEETSRDVFQGSDSLDDYAVFLSRCKAVDLRRHAYCQWMGNDVDCQEILTPILTDEGMCYSFNMIDVRDIYTDINQMRYYREGRRNPDWSPGRGFNQEKIEDNFPRRAFLNGAKNSLIIALLTNKTDIYYSCREFALQGMRVSLHMPAKIPRPSQVFFSVGLNRLTTVSVTPSYMTTTSAIRTYNPHRRNCYFEQERKLKFFKLYNQGNCDFECWSNYTVEKCGCAQFYMPRDNQTKICSMAKRKCFERVKASYTHKIFGERLRDVKGPSDCDCLPLCTELDYKSEIATGQWRFDDPDDVAVDGYEDYYAGFYASAVKIYFKSPYFLSTEKSELYGATDFISNIGGVLGLFTGFSLFSLAEIIYFLSLRLFENYRRYGNWAGPRTE
ncbi:hypothetical protein HHI36_015345 [Cryptolaemus montrouzieri]|uniref:Uncharacterized protein n=1 Tax=Cryptolaemus montrouzieri TaxID=559131 RepID=A0ABD2N6P0_9CUCU